MKRLLILLTIVLFVGCSGNHLKPSEDWKPRAVNAAIVIKSIPPLGSLKQDFLDWNNSVTNKSILLYEINLAELAGRPQIELKVARSETPLGRPWYTYATITVDHPSGPYSLEWSTRGKITREEFQHAINNKKILIQPLLFDTNANVQLPVVGIEGIEQNQVLVAP